MKEQTCRAVQGSAQGFGGSRGQARAGGPVRSTSGSRPGEEAIVRFLGAGRRHLLVHDARGPRRGRGLRQERALSRPGEGRHTVPRLRAGHRSPLQGLHQPDLGRTPRLQAGRREQDRQGPSERSSRDRHRSPRSRSGTRASGSSRSWTRSTRTTGASCPGASRSSARAPASTRSTSSTPRTRRRRGADVRRRGEARWRRSTTSTVHQARHLRRVPEGAGRGWRRRRPAAAAAVATAAQEPVHAQPLDQAPTARPRRDQSEMAESRSRRGPPARDPETTDRHHRRGRARPRRQQRARPKSPPLYHVYTTGDEGKTLTWLQDIVSRPPRRPSPPSSARSVARRQGARGRPQRNLKTFKSEVETKTKVKVSAA
jgi:hypothetical protein